MKLMFIFKWLVSVFNPKYQLTLSEIIKSEKPNKTIYIFKQYGSHEFVKLTFDDIEKNDNLLHSINPKNLMNINLSEFLIKKKHEKQQVIEEIKNNKYKIKNDSEEIIYSGEYIYKNIDMFNKINKLHLYKIIYNTGFEKGRNISKLIQLSNKYKKTEEHFYDNKYDNILFLNKKDNKII